MKLNEKRMRRNTYRVVHRARQSTVLKNGEPWKTFYSNPPARPGEQRYLAVECANRARRDETGKEAQ